VLAAGKKIGGFSAYGGTKTKEKLLALEGVRFDGPASKSKAPKSPAPEPPRLPGL